MIKAFSISFKKLEHLSLGSNKDVVGAKKK